MMKTPKYSKIWLFSFFLFALQQSYAQQAITVTNTLDDGSTGSFRSAITTANGSAGANEIVFDSGVSGTIILTSDLPGVTDDLTITGPGASVLAISGGNKQSAEGSVGCKR